MSSTSSQVRTRIEGGGERLWTLADFPAGSPAAVAQALSRLTREGALERLGPGLYYRPRPTPFGPSLPNPAELLRLAATHAALFPAGASAANQLGFSTQVPARLEMATAAASVPRSLLGAHVRLHTRRPAAWSTLSPMDGALLDFLRQGGRGSELSVEATIRKTLSLLTEPGRFDRLTRAATTEPPRVRALLGALGQRLGGHARALVRLRASLSPLSRFEFGVYAALPQAGAWQARIVRP